jgi:hypothetical protein
MSYFKDEPVAVTVNNEGSSKSSGGSGFEVIILMLLAFVIFFLNAASINLIYFLNLLLCHLCIVHFDTGQLWSIVVLVSLAFLFVMKIISKFTWKKNLLVYLAVNGGVVAIDILLLTLFHITLIKHIFRMFFGIHL